MDVEKQQTNSKRIIGKPFKKGQSGNAKGRPKKELCMTTQLKEVGEMVLYKSILEKLRAQIPEIPKGITFARAVAIRVHLMAIGGDMEAVKELHNRVDGKVPENIRMAGDGGGPLKIMYLATEAACAEEWERESGMRVDAATRAAVPAS
jgi:hypothetical protein